MTDKVFKEYYSESQTEYTYTLKLAVGEITDSMKDVLETCLARYELVSASDFTRTPIQESPLDFPNIRNLPVFIAKISTTYPASRDFLETYISGCLQISEQAVVVYSENDPREYTTAMDLEVNSPEYKENYVPNIGQDGYDGDITNEEAAAMYGAGHNIPFLKELQTAREARVIDIVETPLSLPQENDYADGVPSNYDSFNDTLEDDALSIFGRAPKNASLINSK